MCVCVGVCVCVGGCVCVCDGKSMTLYTWQTNGPVRWLLKVTPLV